MTVPFHAEAARGVRWDDPAIGVDWPDAAGALISDKDRALSGLKD
jgi:dTDP-4-dehydrorhamnose 3,5-epimerase